MTPINVPAQFSENINKGMTGDDRILLPFAAPFFWWKNGESNGSHGKNESGVMYFGGWASNAEIFEANIPTEGDIPAKFLKETWTSGSGNKTFDVYATRFLTVAFIGKRYRWVKDEETGRNFSQAQYLTYMSLYEKATGHKAYCPAVLSVKGMSSVSLQDAINEWGKVTLAARRQFANNAPAAFFYAALGTFGKDRIAKTVGKGQKTHAIIPCQIYVPQTITEEVLNTLYVGDEIASEMVTLLELAKDWMGAWKGSEGEKLASRASAQPENFPAEAAETTLEDLPF
jgi:hypothetical protein